MNNTEYRVEIFCDGPGCRHHTETYKRKKEAMARFREVRGEIVAVAVFKVETVETVVTQYTP